jgi:hypothetical protein
MPDILAKIDDEVTKNGLQHERARLDDALFNMEFYEGDFTRFPPRSRGNLTYDAGRFPRCSLVMQRVVDTLSKNLYAQGPQRRLVAPEGSPARPYDAATAWLDACYSRNRVDAIWQRADAFGAISEAAAFQVSAQADPRQPIKIRLWDASQFCVWMDPDEPTVPIAVATLDVYDERRRLRLYTAEVIRTYMSQVLSPGQTSGGRDFKFRGEVANPYGLTPFSFAHFDLPVTEFWSGSPGTYLRDVNDAVNFQLTEGFDCIRFNLRPILLFKNVRPGYRPKTPVEPGDVWDLSAAADASGESRAEPGAEYLQADSSFVAAGWDDLQAYLDHVLEMCGVPPSAVRMVQDSARSGVSIIAEQLPIIGWATRRQRPFGFYEDDLARLVLRVGARHLGAQAGREYRVTASQLETVAEEPCLALHWPSLYPRIPGQDADQADQFRLDHGLVSRTMLLMERESLTREESEEKLEVIAADLARERELFAEATPPAVGQITSRSEEEAQAEAEAEALAGANGRAPAGPVAGPAGKPAAGESEAAEES